MSSVAVVAHSGKSVGGGLEELRSVLARAGVVDPLWYEVPKSRKAPKRARQAVEAGADVVFVWGGDGMVQRCVDALAGCGVPIAIVPAGTANLLATNLGVPADIGAAVHTGLHGARRRLDVGVVNGEHFAVMAGTGFDALMIRDADGDLKDRLGRLAYVWTGARNLRVEPVRARVWINAEEPVKRHKKQPKHKKKHPKPWFDGQASCILFANVGTLTGGMVAFPDARPDDGVLEVGVVTAHNATQWLRALGRMASKHPERSPFVEMTRARSIHVRLGRALPFELDGGDRPKTKRLRVSVQPGAITVCVPESGVGPA